MTMDLDGKDRAGRDGWVGVGDIEILLLRTTREGHVVVFIDRFLGEGFGGIISLMM